MDSINSNDLEPTGHPRTNDFLGADDNPAFIFEPIPAPWKLGNEFLVHGGLTIRGGTCPVTLEAENKVSSMTLFGPEVSS